MHNAAQEKKLKRKENKKKTKEFLLKDSSTDAK